MHKGIHLNAVALKKWDQTSLAYDRNRRRTRRIMQEKESQHRQQKKHESSGMIMIGYRRYHNQNHKVHNKINDAITRDKLS